MSTDYTGRTVDLAMFPDLTQPNKFVNAEFSCAPKAIAGISMLVQNYVRILLSPLGCYVSDPTFGSNLISRLKQVQYSSDITNAFATENSRVISYMQQNQNPASPLDEQIASATLTGSNISGTSIELDITVVSQAGTGVSLLLPVQWNN